MRDLLQSLIIEIHALRETYGDEAARAALIARTAQLPSEKRARLEALIFLDGQRGEVNIGNVAGGGGWFYIYASAYVTHRSLVNMAFTIFADDRLQRFS